MKDTHLHLQEGTHMIDLVIKIRAKHLQRTLNLKLARTNVDFPDNNMEHNNTEKGTETLSTKFTYGNT